MKRYYNYQLRQWLVTQIVPSHCPNWELNIFYSYHRHQQHIMYVSFQVLSIINDYWFIHRIPVSFSGASTYNKLSLIMMLCCCTHNSLVQCNHSYMIPEYDALYDLKRQWYNEFMPFLSNQPGIDILILGGDVARRYVLPHCWWIFMSIYVYVNRSPLALYKRHLGTFWQSFVVDHHFCIVPGSLSLGEYCFPQLLWSKESVSQSTVSSSCVQITISNQRGASCQPISVI